MAKITAQLVFERETQGAILYKEAAPTGEALKSFRDGTVGNIYVRKSALNGAIPAKITVTVDW